ncbi:MAG TPA: hypothetical protein VGI12_03545 [Vicinamibacterales bacterium]
MNLSLDGEADAPIRSLPQLFPRTCEAKQGSGDSGRFVENDWRPELLKAPFVPSGIALLLRHLIIFMSKFMADHVAGMLERLRRG